MVIWNSFTDKIRRPFSKRFAKNLKSLGPTFPMIIQMQSVSIVSVCVHPCFSFLLLYFFNVVQRLKWLLQCCMSWHYIILRDVTSLNNEFLRLANKDWFSFSRVDTDSKDGVGLILVLVLAPVVQRVDSVIRRTVIVIHLLNNRGLMSKNQTTFQI